MLLFSKKGLLSSPETPIFQLYHNKVPFHISYTPILCRIIFRNFYFYYSVLRFCFLFQNHKVKNDSSYHSNELLLHLHYFVHQKYSNFSHRQSHFIARIPKTLSFFASILFHCDVIDIFIFIVCAQKIRSILMSTPF